ncbi:MAG TPA: class I SAM-dependent methyltransferase [Candidatus Gastranaerophilales bacterium]|nr:class I SAM-dependent methyltransferase [Candidatus Gastranaerophilales bacterium]
MIKEIFCLNYIIFNNLIKEAFIRTHLTNEEKINLYRFSKKLKKQNPIALEIGSYLGASGCFLAKGLKGFNGRLYCVDTWQNNAMDEPERDTFNEFTQNIKKYTDIIIPLKGKSCKVVEEFRKTGKNIDLLFIDGDHSYESCKTDWDLYSPLLNKNAVVIFHDTGWAEGAQRVIKENVVNIADKILELKNMQAFKLK